MLQYAVQSRVADRLMHLFEHNHEATGYSCLVLTYHQVENVTGFAAQMAHVAQHYDVISMPELLEAMQTGQKLPPRAILISFDDAYRNFADCAWPILRQYELPATLFVPTAFPDQPERNFWWDQLAYAFRLTERRDFLQTAVGRLPLQTAEQRQQAVKLLKRYLWTLLPNQVESVTERIIRELDVTPPASEVLSWEFLRSLAAEGVTLGAHTRTHPNLARLSPAAVKAEVAGSLRDLEREVGVSVPVFAYPGGYFNEETTEAVAEAGVELAFTTRRGTNDIRNRHERLKLRRNNIGAQATLPVLRARLLQAAPTLSRLQHLIGVQ